MKLPKRLICVLTAVICLVQPFAVLAFAADGSMILSGDVDGDGRVTAADARFALRISASLYIVADEVIPYADSDGNGKVTAGDARTILRYSALLCPDDDLNRIEKPTQKPLASGNIAYGNKKWLSRSSLDEGENTLLGENIFLRADTNYKWTSSNPAVVSVDQNGYVTALKKGFSCVYLTVGDVRYYWYITVLSELQSKIFALQDKYPGGYYWNRHTKSEKYPYVSEIPCDDHEAGRYAYCQGQCAGFAELMSNEVFGAWAPVSHYSDKSKIKIGDYLRMLPNHSVFVIDRVNKGEIVDYDMYSDRNYQADEGYIIVCECNWDWHCGIDWGRYISYDKIRLDSSLSYTRY